MQDHGFEWDAAKAQSNRAKHGVAFEAACLAFGDLFALDRIDIGGDLPKSDTSSRGWPTASC
jgi:uncharacterized DUF497 family protein